MYEYAPGKGSEELYTHAPISQERGDGELCPHQPGEREWRVVSPSARREGMESCVPTSQGRGNGELCPHQPGERGWSVGKVECGLANLIISTYRFQMLQDYSPIPNLTYNNLVSLNTLEMTMM